MTHQPETAQALLAPTSIAVVGASSDPAKIGGRPIDFLIRYGYPGRIVPINNRARSIQGIPAVGSVRDLSTPVDQAIIALPTAAVCDAVEECADAGIRSAVIFSAGFGELSAEGRAAETRMRRIANDAGMRLLGPNCMGLINVRAKVYSTFTLAFQHERWRPGNVAVVSQSGAFGAHFLRMAYERDFGISNWISTGNEIDVDAGECIKLCATDDDTTVIAVYMEACRNGPVLVDALRLAHDLGKQVVLLKVGRSPIGARAAESHTGALAGADDVFDAVCKHYGVHRAQRIDEMADVVGACAKTSVLPADRSVAIVTVSGGVGALMADAAHALDLTLPKLPSETVERIRGCLSFVTPQNPVDTTAHILQDISILETILESVLASNCVSSVAVFLTMLGHSMTMRDRVLSVLRATRERHPNCLVVIAILAPPDVREELDSLGYLTFEDPTRVMEVIAALAAWSERRRAPKLRANGSDSYAANEPPPNNANELDALRWLRAVTGILIPDAKLARSVEEAVAFSCDAHGPVVLKVASADITHKSAVGGVALGVQGAVDVRLAYERILTSVRRHHPGAHIDGLLVAPQANPGVDAMVGTRRDSIFGPVVVTGVGGILTEVVRDVAVRLAPLSVDEASTMIRETRLGSLLSDTGRRDLACVVASTSTLLRDARLAAVDVNPVRVFADGGCIALDAVLYSADLDAAANQASADSGALAPDDQ